LGRENGDKKLATMGVALEARARQAIRAGSPVIGAPMAGMPAPAPPEHGGAIETDGTPALQ
jgi:hypothetical protein